MFHHEVKKLIPITHQYTVATPCLLKKIPRQITEFLKMSKNNH